MPLFLSMYLFSLVGFLIHYFSLKPEGRNLGKLIELLLLYQLIFSIGMTSFLAFIGLTFIPEYIAAYTDWPVCPFQQELGNVNLAFGVLGIMAIWLRGHFWTATVVGFSIWILADALHHLIIMIKYRNYSPGNVGIPLITDIVIPVVSLLLLFFYLTHLTHRD